MEESFRAVGGRTYERRMPGQYFYVTIEPENVKAILATQFKEFGKGPLVHARWKDVPSSPVGFV
jgi:hypothetical protein